MKDSLKEKFAIVTGASTGIGRAIALALAKEGAFVALVARREEKLNETLMMIEELGGMGKVFLCDLSNKDSVNEFIKEITDQTTHVDIICNVAGIWHGVNEVYADTDFSKFDQKTVVDTFNVGLIAPTLIVHGLISLMPRGSKIINISGTFEDGAKGWLPYYVSKKGIEALTTGLSEELKDSDIQVNCVSPSDTSTEEYRKYFPQYVNDAVTPEEISKYVLFLCSDKAKEITGKIKVIKKKVMPTVIKEVGFDFHWDEDKVWALDLPVEEMPISELTWHFDTPFWFTKGGYYDLMPKTVIENPKDHIEEYGRTMAADLNYPLDIMFWKGRWLLLDGLHRLAKAFVLEAKTVQVRKVPIDAIPLISSD